MDHTIRITVNRDYYDAIKLLCETLFTKYICGFEYAPRTKKEHYHIVYWGCHLSIKQIKDEIRKVIPGISGNGMWAFEEIKNYNTIGSYTLKDGDFHSKGFTDAELQDLISGSFQKVDFSEELKKLEDYYLTNFDTIYPEIFVTNVIQKRLELHVKCNRIIKTDRSIISWIYWLDVKRKVNTCTHLSLAKSIASSCGYFTPVPDAFYYRKDLHLDSDTE